MFGGMRAAMVVMVVAVAKLSCRTLEAAAAGGGVSWCGGGVSW